MSKFTQQELKLNYTAILKSNKTPLLVAGKHTYYIDPHSVQSLIFHEGFVSFTCTIGGIQKNISISYRDVDAIGVEE